MYYEVFERRYLGRPYWPTPEQILNRIVHSRDERFTPEKTYIILGRTGPTGKTWLTTQLRKRGFKAIEITEGLSGLLGVYDFGWRSGNHMVVDEMYDYVLIVLNERLRGFEIMIKFDRETALSILKDISKDMRPSNDLFGNKTLVISRDKFELIRKKYLDESGDTE